MDEVLYKYRGIQSFRYFADIILRNRLFAAAYTDMNDPMEGQYYYSGGSLSSIIKAKISSEKMNLRICSLSQKNDNHLMWAHYAEGHRGVAIGLRVDTTQNVLRPVEYTGIQYFQGSYIEYKTAQDILSHKLEIWSYEEEKRIFTRGIQYVDVQVVEVITGLKMSNQDFGFVREFVERINPQIAVIKAENFMNRSRLENNFL